MFRLEPLTEDTYQLILLAQSGQAEFDWESMCHLCDSVLIAKETCVLAEGKFGTYDWGKKHGDSEIVTEVAWTGDNWFCKPCFVSGAYVVSFLEPTSVRRQDALKGNSRELETWLHYLEEYRGFGRDGIRNCIMVLLEPVWAKFRWNHM